MKQPGTNITVEVNVTKIVKYVCLAGAVIVGIIFCQRGYSSFLKYGPCNQCKDQTDYE